MAAEWRIAELLQKAIVERFPKLRVFRSSDDSSIPIGEEQYKTILTALQEARYFIFLLSRQSSRRPWVAFEAGYAHSRKVLNPEIRRAACLIRGASGSDIPSPLNEYQARPLSSKAVFKSILLDCGAIDSNKPDYDDDEFNDFRDSLLALEAEMPDYSLTMDPFTFGPSGEDLAFELRYQGGHPLRIAEVWAEVPEQLVPTERWPIVASDSTGHVKSVRVERDGRRFWRRTLTPAQDLSRLGPGFEPLRELLPPGSRRALRELRYRVRPTSEADGLGNLEVRCGLVTADEGESRPFVVLWSDVEYRSDYSL